MSQVIAGQNKRTFMQRVATFGAQQVRRRTLVASRRQDLQILFQLRRSIAAGMWVPQDAFPYRPMGEPSFLRRRHILAELYRPSITEETLVLCPLPDRTQVVRNLRITGQALVLIPEWPRQQWYEAVLRLSSNWERLEAPTSQVLYRENDSTHSRDFSYSLYHQRKCRHTWTARRIPRL